jgi:trimeric autotransporter adhesin
VVRGLVIDRFSGSGILVRDLDDTKIEGNFIGTDPSGTLDQGNGADGVAILNGATFNTVGGNAQDNPAARNLISGNDADGVEVHGFTSVGLNTTRNEVLGNLIGVQRDGTSPLGNSDSGVLIKGASSNSVGSGSASSANTVASNGKDGVTVVGANGDDAVGNTIGVNTVFSNADLGIDLLDEGPTANDGDNPNTPQVDPDSDTGPNGLQNKPVLTSAKNGAGKTAVKGTLNALPNTVHLLLFYSNPSGGDEGRVFVGFKSVTTDASGNASFSFQPTNKVARGRTITATATASPGSFVPNTSEFGAPRTVR